MKNDIETGFAIRTDQHTFSINDQPEGRIVKPQKGLRIKPDDIVVVRLKGFYTDLSGWSGNKDYIPAEYQIWQIIEVKENGLLLSGKARLLIDFPVKN